MVTRATRYLEMWPSAEGRSWESGCAPLASGVSTASHGSDSSRCVPPRLAIIFEIAVVVVVVGSGAFRAIARSRAWATARAPRRAQLSTLTEGSESAAKLT
jgi:hypothetical protein